MHKVFGIVFTLFSYYFKYCTVIECDFPSIKILPTFRYLKNRSIGSNNSTFPTILHGKKGSQKINTKVPPLGTNRIITNISMESIVIRSISHRLHTSIGQQDVIFSLRYSIVVFVLRVAKIVSGVEITNTVPKCISRLLLLQVTSCGN